MRRHGVPLLSLFMITLMVALLFAHIGFSFREDGWTRHFGMRILQGDMPYRDFFIPTTPFIYYLSAALTAFFGPAPQVEWAAMVVIRFLLFSTIYLMAVELWKNRTQAFLVALIAAAIQLLFANRWWYLWYCDAAMTAFAITALLMWKNERRLLIGLGLFLTLGLKQTYGLTLLALFFLTRRSLTATATFLILTGLSLSYLWMNQALAPFFQNVFIDAPTLKSDNTLTKLFSLGPYFDLRTFVLGHLLGAYLVFKDRRILLCLAGLFFYVVVKRFPDILEMSSVTGQLITGSITVALPWYFWPRRLDAPGYFLFAGALFLLAQRASGWTNGIVLLIPALLYQLRPLRPIRLSLAAWILIAGMFFRTHHQVGEVGSAFALRHHPHIEAISSYNVSKETANLLERIDQLSFASDRRVMFYPSALVLYDLLQVEPIDRTFEVYYPDFLPARGQEKVLQVLQTAPPPYIICDPYGPIERPFDKELYTILERDYILSETIPNGYGRKTYIYKLRKPT